MFTDLPIKYRYQKYPDLVNKMIFEDDVVPQKRKDIFYGLEVRYSLTTSTLTFKYSIVCFKNDKFTLA